MNGQASVDFAEGQYIDPTDPFYFGAKLHFMPTPQPFVPVASPELTSLNKAQKLAELAELEKLSNEYTPEYTPEYTVLNPWEMDPGRLYYGTQDGF